MAQLTEADRYLLQQIAKGDSEGWSQLVERYQGRLLAFARSRLSRREEAEDLVQDTFIAFLESISRFRENASVETYLFTILRRKLIDQFRGRAGRVCFLQDVLDSSSGSGDREPNSGSINLADEDQQTASWYVRNAEHDRTLRTVLAVALEGLIDRLKGTENFRDLQIVEMIFYAQVRNKDIAGMMGMDEKAIGLIKHRALKEIQQHVLASKQISRGDEQSLSIPSWENTATAATMLTEVWEEIRPTCPKRSTVGRFLLGSLEPAWQQYVEFHLNKLGCQFCRANLDDLKQENKSQPAQMQHRVLQSTAGFFKKG